jgi:hypothetical protein
MPLTWYVADAQFFSSHLRAGILQDTQGSGTLWLFRAVKMIVLASTMCLLFAIFFRYGCVIYLSLKHAHPLVYENEHIGSCECLLCLTSTLIFITD